MYALSDEAASGARRVVVITGASSGIGLALAERSARGGYDVLAIGRRRERLERLRDDVEGAIGSIAVLALDITEPGAARTIVATARDHFGGIDVLVNNAGGVAVGPISSQSDEALHEQVDTHIVAPLALLREALASLQERRGQVIFVGSGVARIPVGLLGAYPPAKAAVRNLTRIVRNDLRAHDVAVTYVDPGAVATEFMTRAGFAGPPPLLAAPAHRVARRIYAAFATRAKTVNGVPWQTSIVAIGESLPNLTDFVLSRVPQIVGGGVVPAAPLGLDTTYDVRPLARELAIPPPPAVPFTPLDESDAVTHVDPDRERVTLESADLADVADTADERVTAVEPEPELAARVEPEPVAHLEFAPVADAVPEHVAHIEPEPIAHLEPEPVAHVEPEPVAHIEPDPVAHVEPEPVAHVEPEPVARIEPEPEPVAHDEPEPVAHDEPEPVAHDEPEPVAHVEADPVAHVEPEPIAHIEPEVVAHVEPEPVAHVEPEAVVHVEPEPIAHIEPEPIAHVEPEPVAPVEPEPVAHVEPEPVAHIEPESVAHVESEPVAHIEPEPVAHAEPEPEPVTRVTPEPEFPVAEHAPAMPTFGTGPRFAPADQQLAAPQVDEPIIRLDAPAPASALDARRLPIIEPSRPNEPAPAQAKRPSVFARLFGTRRTAVENTEFEDLPLDAAADLAHLPAGASAARPEHEVPYPTPGERASTDTDVAPVDSGAPDTATSIWNSAASPWSPPVMAPEPEPAASSPTAASHDGASPAADLPPLVVPATPVTWSAPTPAASLEPAAPVTPFEPVAPITPFEPVSPVASAEIAPPATSPQRDRESTEAPHPEFVEGTPFEQALAHTARRMQRLNLSHHYLARLLVPGDVLFAGDVALRWAGMPNKNERALTAEVLHALADAGFLERLADDRFRVLRGAR